MHGSSRQDDYFARNTVTRETPKIDKMSSLIADMFVSFGMRQDTALVRAKSWATELTYFSIETIQKACHIAKNNTDQMKTLNQFRQIIRNEVEALSEPKNDGYELSKDAENDRQRARKNWLRALEKFGKEEMQKRLETYMKQHWIISKDGQVASRLLLMDMMDRGEL